MIEFTNPANNGLRTFILEKRSIMSYELNAAIYIL
jgi:hypothetical protein